MAGVVGTAAGRVRAEQVASAGATANDQTQKRYAVIEWLFADLNSHADVTGDPRPRSATAGRGAGVASGASPSRKPRSPWEFQGLRGFALPAGRLPL